MLRKCIFKSILLFHTTTPAAWMRLSLTVRPQPRNPGSPVSLTSLSVYLLWYWTSKYFLKFFDNICFRVRDWLCSPTALELESFWLRLPSDRITDIPHQDSLWILSSKGRVSLCVVPDACDSNTLKAEAGGQGAQSHPWLGYKLEISLGYVTPNIKHTN